MCVQPGNICLCILVIAQIPIFGISGRTAPPVIGLPNGPGSERDISPLWRRVPFSAAKRNQKRCRDRVRADYGSTLFRLGLQGHSPRTPLREIDKILSLKKIYALKVEFRTDPLYSLRRAPPYLGKIRYFLHFLLILTLFLTR